MRKCFACEKMSAVVTMTKKPNGKPGYICPPCKREGKDPGNDWYYWSRNQHVHFIVFRLRENQVAQAGCRTIDGRVYRWAVTGPCWSTYQEQGRADSLEEAKKAVDTRVMKIIEEEFEPEPVHPMG